MGKAGLVGDPLLVDVFVEARQHAQDLRRGLDLIAQADADVRNGTLPNRLLIELVVTRIAAAGARA